MNKGYIKLYRELIDKPIWVNSSPAQRTILITLLLMANHKPNEWDYAGRKFTVEAGQFITSVDSIVKKCHSKDITTRKVRTALERFEKIGFLTRKTTNKNTLITIVNWGKYQGVNSDFDKQCNNQMTNNRQTVDNQMTTNNNDNNIKNDKNEKEIHTRSLFDRFWELYPKRVHRKCAFDTWKSLNVDDNLFNSIISGLKSYLNSSEYRDRHWRGNNQRYIPYPENWLRNRCWEDEYNTVTPDERGTTF